MLTFDLFDLCAGAADTATAADKLNDLRESGNMGTGKYELLVLDLTSLESVRAFAQKILDKNVPINLLLNNGNRACEKPFEFAWLYI